MSKLNLDEVFKSETGNDTSIIDHNGNYSSSYVEWLEEKVEALASDLRHNKKILEEAVKGSVHMAGLFNSQENRAAVSVLTNIKRNFNSSSINNIPEKDQT